ncbi:MAG: hypothetical protein AAGE59_09530 [Cyanobacteria bacterium P01_F01_bin.86]
MSLQTKNVTARIGFVAGAVACGAAGLMYLSTDSIVTEISSRQSISDSISRDNHLVENQVYAEDIVQSVINADSHVQTIPTKKNVRRSIGPDIDNMEDYAHIVASESRMANLGEFISPDDDETFSLELARQSKPGNIGEHLSVEQYLSERNDSMPRLLGENISVESYLSTRYTKEQDARSIGEDIDPSELDD